MLKRILTAVVALPLFFVVLFFLPPIFLTLAISAVSVIAVYELLWATRFVREALLLVFLLAASAAIPFKRLLVNNEALFILAVILALVFVLFVYAISGRGKMNFEKLSGVFFAAFIIPLFMGTLDEISALHEITGRYLFLLPFIAAWTSDAFAYFVGTFFGKHKLLPEVSAKKTVEGSAGGLAGAVVCMLIFGFVMETFLHFKANYVLLGLLGFAGSIFAQVGDLAMSYIKREFRLKDYGTIMPGHGGVLDRFDSVLFTSPLFLIVLRLTEVLKV